MAGYIGSKASVVSSGVERKKTYNITGSTTSLTGLNYTVGKVHVYQNGVRLLDGTDYTATNGTSITLTVAAQSGDNVVVVSQASFQLSESYTSTEADARYVQPTHTGNLNITGTVTADGLTVDGAHPDIALGETDTTNLNTGLTSASGAFQVSTINDSYNFSARVNRLNIDHSTGDISFYEDTGTTAKFFWDASAESLGIGVGTSVGEPLHVKGTGRFENSNATPVSVHINSGNNDYGQIFSSTSSAWKNLVLNQYGGNVGIGTSSPSASLHISKSDDARLVLTDTGDSCTFMVRSDGANTSIGTDTAHPVRFMTNNSERMRIDSSGQVGIGTSSPSKDLEVVSGTTATTIKVKGTAADGYRHGYELQNSHTGGTTYSMFTTNSSDGLFGGGKFAIANADIDSITAANTRLVIDSSGNVLVGKTTSSSSSEGCEFRDGGSSSGYAITATSNNNTTLSLNRTTSDGNLIQFRKDGSSVGNISCSGGELQIGTTSGAGLYFGGSKVQPTYNGSFSDNTIDLGHPDRRFDDIYATNGTIQTSDFNEKQDIASLTATEMLVGKRISALFKTFRWKDSVTKKGDNARTHTGVIAQDVQAAFTAEGLDTGNYALFISSTWWETQTEVPAVEAVSEVTDEDGNVTTEAVEAKDAYTRTDTYDTEDEAPEGATERTRLGIRYPELLSFVAAYNEQRFASIEARLTALEA
jgi:hypothetical protein